MTSSAITGRAGNCAGTLRSYFDSLTCIQPGDAAPACANGMDLYHRHVEDMTAGQRLQTDAMLPFGDQTHIKAGPPHIDAYAIPITGKLAEVLSRQHPPCWAGVHQMDR